MIMIINHKTEDKWKELYPKTLADNVEMNDGKTIQDLVDGYEPSVRFGNGYTETNGKTTIIFKDKMFIMTQSLTMTSITQNKYHRLRVALPFSNVESYNVSVTLTDGVGQTQNVYVREKNKDNFQLSTIAIDTYDDGYTVDVDIQVVGVLED